MWKLFFNESLLLSREPLTLYRNVGQNDVNITAFRNLQKNGTSKGTASTTSHVVYIESSLMLLDLRAVHSPFLFRG